MQLLLQDIMQQRREQNVFKKSSHYPRYLKKKEKIELKTNEYQ